MINVNQKFIDSCNSDVVASQFKLFLMENKTGYVLATLNDNEFTIDSGSIEKQASSGAVLNIGGVCSNRVKVTLNQQGINKVTSVDGFKKNYVLHLVQWNKVDDVNQSTSDYSLNLDNTENQTGKCDLGFYYISEITNNYYDCDLICYDGMIAFNQNMTITQIKYLRTNSKTVDQWLAYFCSLVNDNNFSISYTDNAEVTCNDGVSFKLSEDSSFETMREAISQLAMLKMAYATMDIQGNLTLKPAIKANSSSYDDTVNNAYMYSCDNEIVESVVKHFYTSVAGFEYENNYVDEENRNQINVFLEENKFLRGFEPYNGSALSSSTLTCLRNMSQSIMGQSFYSCECEINERPYLELGDNVQIQRKFVDQQGTVTLESIDLVIDNLSHNLGSTTQLSSNSTVSTNTSSSGKMSLSNTAKTPVNSQPKEPSTSDVYNDITEELNNPVITYTDTTATIRIRVDDKKSGNFDDKDYFNALSSYSPTYDTIPLASDMVRYQVNNLSNASKVLYTRGIKELEQGKYIYDANFRASDLNSCKVKYTVTAGRKKGLNSLKGLTIPILLNYAGEYTLKEATITDVKLDNQSRPLGVGQPRTAKKLTSLPSSSDLNTYFTLSDVAHTEQWYNYILAFAKAQSDAGISGEYPDLSTSFILKQKIEYDLGLDTVPGSTLISRFNSVKNLLDGYSIYADYTSKTKYVNPHLSGWQDFLKYELIIPESYGLTITYTDTQDVEQTRNISLYAMIWCCYSPGSGFTDEFLQQLASAQSSYVSTYRTIYATILDSLTHRISDYYIEATYTTTNVPLSDSDKNSVDNDVVKPTDIEDINDDLSGLEARVSNNEQQIENIKGRINTLNNDITSVNNDLQDTKQDIATNTQNISALDGRVDTLEANAVEANPSEAPTGTLTKIKVNDVVYDVPTGGGGGGTTVIANPSGQAAADLEKLQVGNIIYGIPSGGGVSNDELVLTSEHTITLLGNNANTHMNYDKVLYQEGNSFINYDTTTGFWTVNEDTLLSVEMQSDISDSANLWLTYKIYECNSANITDIVGAMGQLYYNRTLGYIKYPIVKCRQGYYYFIAGVKANSGNWTITASNYDSTTGLYKLSNFARFVKKNGVYTPT